MKQIPSGQYRINVRTMNLSYQTFAHTPEQAAEWLGQTLMLDADSRNTTYPAIQVDIYPVMVNVPD